MPGLIQAQLCSSALPAGMFFKQTSLMIIGSRVVKSEVWEFEALGSMKMRELKLLSW